MFAAPHVFNLLVDEFAGSGGGRLAFLQVFLGAFDRGFRWHYASFCRCLITDAIWQVKNGATNPSSPRFPAS
jgi:hypothetical protein